MSEKDTKMVAWYDPWQLLDTARKTVISTIIGENADPRLVTAAATSGKFFDYSQGVKINKDNDFDPNGEPRKEIWIDYVSDVGDGWNSTYSVAYSLAQLNLKNHLTDETLERGEILIFGGDGVYPTATPEEYHKKLTIPYQMAFNSSRKGNSDTDKTDLKKSPHVFVLPGNHDWYDSLVAFQKIFCTHIFNARTFAGGWRTRQKRSYFTLKLPHNWWLLGVDLQLSHNIDVRQLQYFESVILKMQKGDKVILCVPEPYWVKTIKYEGVTEVFKEKEASIEKLEELLRKQGVEVKVYIAGDLHHYRRFESEDGRRIQKITAGGGGAFLHPTHDFDFNAPTAGKIKNAKGFSLKKEFPEYEDSKKMDKQNLFFLFRNPTFGILTAILYPLLALIIYGDLKGKFSWGEAFKITLDRLISEPLALIVVFLMLMGLIFFTDSNSKSYRRTAGLIHGLTHLTAIFILGWWGFRLKNWLISNWEISSLPITENQIWFLSIWLVCGAGGYILGSIIMGLYLYISLNWFKRHDNEAFSALKIQDYKNFLRLHIDGNGKLKIFPMGIKEVPCDWEETDKGNGKFYQPKEKLEAKLIEDEIVI